MSLQSALGESLAGSLPPGSLTTLGSLIPTADQCLGVDDALRPLFPYGGLVRGQVVGCGGTAAVSLAMAMVARAVSEGSWLAVVGFAEFGAEAALELGVPLARVVRVDGGRSPREWAERVAACADGFDLVMVADVPAAAVLRRVRQRLQARGSVLVIVDPRAESGRAESGRADSGGQGCDTYFDAVESRWVGIGAGHGALMARMVTVSVSGRRAPSRPASGSPSRPASGHGRAQQVGHRVWLPGPKGGIEAVSDESADDHRLVS